MKASLLVSVGLLLFIFFILENSSITPLAQADVKEKPLTSSLPTPQGAPSESKSIEIDEYEEIRALFSQEHFDETEKKSSLFLETYPDSEFSAAIENIRGIIFLRNKNIVKALSSFKKALKPTHESSSFYQYVLYNLAAAQFEGNDIVEAEKTVQKISSTLLDQSNQLKLISLKANLLDKKNQYNEVISMIFSSTLRYDEEDLKPVKKSLEKISLHALDQINDKLTLEKFISEYEGSPLSDLLMFRMGTYHLRLNHYGQAESLFNLLLKQYPESSFKEEIQRLLSQKKDDSKVNIKTIGVLLPLQGKFAKYGLRSLQGIQLALGIFDNQEPDSQLKLIIEDGGEDPESNIEALNRLAFKHRVGAVIGPMLSKGAEQVFDRAEEIGIPLISLSRKSPQNPEYVFSAGLTHSLLAHEAARHAITHLGLKKLAILSPHDKFGKEMTQAFWDAAESLGGEIVGYETYSPSDTDFRSQIDKLSGLHYLSSRQSELDALAKEREINQIKKRTRKTEKYFQLPPVVDFEAVFIPDEAKISGQIIPTFAYRDVEKVKFIGTSAWNSTEFLNRISNTGDYSYFVDVLLTQSSQNQVTSRFTQAYRNTFKQDATSIDAMAYDAALLLKPILSSSSIDSRKDIKQSLKSIRGFTGATGMISYEEGKFYRELKLISIQSGQFKEVSP